MASRCGDDAALRDEVTALLALYEASGDSIPPPESPEDLGDLPARIGPWHIRGRLGVGGMGFVYQAYRPRVDEVDVALKVIRPGIVSPEVLLRFGREIESLRRLRHPGIARLLEAGILDGPAGTQPYLVMERIEGVTLREWARAGPSSSEAIEVLARVGDALAHAHASGVVHRDLKPENVMIRPDGTPCVLDFGVARLSGTAPDASTIMTSPGLIVGTIRYMSPEQAGAGTAEPDARSDVYSLAVVGYELLSGRLPYEVPEDSFHRALAAVLTHPPTPLKELSADFRRPLEAVLGRALAKRDSERYGSAGEFAEELRRVRRGQRPRATASSVMGVPVKSLPIVGVLILAVLGILAVRARPSLREWAVGLLDPAAVFRLTIADLDSAYTRLHLTTRTEPRLEEALAYCTRAMERVRTVPWQPWAPRLARFGFERLAESHYLLGERHLDPRSFRRAARFWREAADTRLAAPPVGSLPDPGQRLNELVYADASYARAPLLSAGMALCDAARLDDPLPLLDESWAARQSFARDFEAPGVGDRHQQVLLLNALGETLASMAEHANDPLLADSAIHTLDRARRLPESQGEPSEQASLAHNRGHAFLQRARLTGSRADLDSARALFGEALVVRRHLPGYVSQFLTRREYVNALRLAIRRTTSATERRRLLHQAHRLASEPFEQAHADLPDACRGLLALTLAAVEIDRGCLERDSARFTVADSLLAMADRTLSLPNQPLLACAYHRQRARISALRWAMDHTTERRVETLTDLARLRSTMWRGASSRLSREHSDATQRFLYRPPEPFGLDYPLD